MYVFCLGNNRTLSEWELSTVLQTSAFEPHTLGVSLPDKVADSFDFTTLQSHLGGTKEIVWFHDYVFSSWEQAQGILQNWLKELPGREMTLVADHLNDSQRKIILDEIKTLMDRKVRYRLDKRYLLKEKGLVFWWYEQEPGKYIFGQAVSQQAIEEYSKRDYGKPARSMVRGMLPPKLAQIMVNGAGTKADDVIWDPFCGTGTVLVETALMGKKCIGSDKDKAAIEASVENIAALLNEEQRERVLAVWQQDITLNWPAQSAQATCIVAEGFLGQPQTKKVAAPTDLRTFWQQVEPMYQKFFAKLLNSPVQTIVLGTPLVSTESGHSRLALRAWNILLQAGWQKVFQADYIRADQIVGREITKLVRE